MTYEQFKTIPVKDYNNLLQMIVIKLIYGLNLTKFEETLLDYFVRFGKEYVLKHYKNHLNRCFAQ